MHPSCFNRRPIYRQKKRRLIRKENSSPSSGFSFGEIWGGTCHSDSNSHTYHKLTYPSRNGSANFVGKICMVSNIFQALKVRSKNIWRTLCNFLQVTRRIGALIVKRLRSLWREISIVQNIKGSVDASVIS